MSDAATESPKRALIACSRRSSSRWRPPALLSGAFAVWVNRQALNTDNSSSELLADEQVQAALGPYLVDQLFTNADVTGAIQQRLPSNLQMLAGPASAGLRQLAERAAPELLARPGCRMPG